VARSGVTSQKVGSGKYRPHFCFIGGPGKFLGAALTVGPRGPAIPTQTTFDKVESMQAPAVAYTELVVAAEFELLKGLKGAGS
jgi:hypothetical protein